MASASPGALPMPRSDGHSTSVRRLGRSLRCCVRRTPNQGSGSTSRPRWWSTRPEWQDDRLSGLRQVVQISNRRWCRFPWRQLGARQALAQADGDAGKAAEANAGMFSPISWMQAIGWHQGLAPKASMTWPVTLRRRRQMRPAGTISRGMTPRRLPFPTWLSVAHSTQEIAGDPHRIASKPRKRPAWWIGAGNSGQSWKAGRSRRREACLRPPSRLTRWLQLDRVSLRNESGGDCVSNFGRDAESVITLSDRMIGSLELHSVELHAAWVPGIGCGFPHDQPDLVDEGSDIPILRWWKVECGTCQAI